MRTVANKEICLILKNIIENVSTEYDKIWRKRARKIDSKFLINFIFQLVLNSKSSRPRANSQGLKLMSRESRG